MRRSITLSDIATASSDSLRESMYHCWPGSVVAFHASSETVDVQPMVNDVRYDLLTDARVSEPWPVIYGVKLAWPKFGGFELVGPMSPGDGVILQAFDLDPTAYFQTGNRSDPAHVARHAGTYWAAHPANLTNAGVSPDAAAAAGAAIIGAAGKAAQIRFNGTTIQLGAAGGDFVALASKVDANTAQIKTFADAVNTILGNLIPASGVTAGQVAAFAAAVTAFKAALEATGSSLVAAQ
jgi:hypothetical protein